uniref:Glycosyl transferase CAP10 domain-containing protein n=1 Tax=Aureoumbra lagunensis TaxID=44058 RepID=A0A7S3JNS2_9STRA|mmetsp:Transcript_13773/g.18378  ORF Transcript_13773/g.18378 Transcript_13773/m.18378 type:complete len:421 (+) Transcript_13773:176-1438(+)
MLMLHYVYLKILFLMIALHVRWSHSEDVRAYFEQNFSPSHSQIAHCDLLRPQKGGECIYLHPSGRIIHGRDFINEAGNGKQMLMDLMLRKVIAEIQRRQMWKPYWRSFQIVYAASGPMRQSKCPVLGIGKLRPSQPGLLVPNPFFVSPSWWDNYLNQSLEFSASRPWNNRTNRLLFRGACGPGSQARFNLMQLPDTEHELDVGFTKADGYPTLEACVLALAKKMNATESDVHRILLHRLKSHVPQSEYSNYRFLLHMPGSSTGSYSRNLQHLFAHGAIVLIWKHSAVEWYYSHLKPGIHYLPVDAHTLYPTMSALIKNQRMQNHLRLGARRFCDEFLNGRHLVARWESIFAALENRQSNTTTVDFVLRGGRGRACTCEPTTADFSFSKCAKCEVTTLKPSRMARLIGITRPTKPHHAPPS